MIKFLLDKVVMRDRTESAPYLQIVAAISITPFF
jgi:hypothetical protein